MRNRSEATRDARPARPARGRGLGAAVCALAVAVALAFGSIALTALGVVDPASLLGRGGRSSGDAVVPTVLDEAPDPVVEIDLLMVGDMLVHQGVWQSGQRADGTYNYDHLFAHVAADVSAADLAIVNQETPLGGTELGLQGFPTFNSPQELGDAEVAAGFDVAASATNHTVDQGAAGVANTLAFWREEHPEMMVLGMADSQETYDEIHYYEKDGFRIALLNYTYGTNGLPIPAENPWATMLLDEGKVGRDLEIARETADMVVVLPHWGNEYVTEPSSYQRQWAQFLCDNGADLIIGCHPHCLEPVEVIEGADGQRTLCYWSLGNFVSCQSSTLKATGGMAKVTLAKQGDECWIAGYELVPVVTHQASGTAFTTYPLSAYSDDLAAVNWSQSGTVGQIDDFCAEVLGEGYDRAAHVFRGGEVRSG